MKISMHKRIMSLLSKTAAFAMLLTSLAITDGLAQHSNNDTKASIAAPIQKGYAPVNGLQLYYEIHGNGEPLILLHGGLGSTDMLAPIVQVLSKNRQVIAVDLQGHGRTADINRPFSMQLMADDIAGLLKHLNIKQADIMGYSMGGWVAFQTAIRHPEVVRKLVVVSAPVKRNAFHKEVLAQQDQMGAGAAEFLKQTPIYQLYAHVAPKPEDWPKLVSKMGDVMKVDYDWSTQIKTIKAATLIIAGDADIFTPTHAAETFALLGGGLKDAGWDGSGLTASQLAILPHTTHYNILMSPDLAPTVASFLDVKTK